MTKQDERDPLGARMKDYEFVSRTVLPKRTYTIMRLDGRAFHTYTKGLKRPFDPSFTTAMSSTARVLANQVSGCKIAYVQSDEISLVLTDFDHAGTEAWFGGQVQKMVSTSAAIASTVFNVFMSKYAPSGDGDVGRKIATFDSRVFTLPSRTEVENYLIWRQRDCMRNAVSMLAQHHFSHRELQGVSTQGMEEKLHALRGVQEIPDGVRYGRTVLKHWFDDEVTFTHKGSGEVMTQSARRSSWKIADAEVLVPGGFITGLLPVPE